MGIQSSDVLELVESLPIEEQEKIRQEYEAYLKREVRRGNTFVLSPQTWVESKGIGKPKPVDPEHESRIRYEFKRIMIEAGHGSVMERALFDVKGI